MGFKIFLDVTYQKKKRKIITIMIIKEKKKVCIASLYEELHFFSFFFVGFERIFVCKEYKKRKISENKQTRFFFFLYTPPYPAKAMFV